MYKESKNIVVKHLVNRLRDVRTTSNEFRLTIEEISRIIASEALSNFETITQNINTWQGPFRCRSNRSSKTCISTNFKSW